MGKKRLHHIIRNDVKETVTTEQLRLLNENNEDVRCDIEWYLSHGYVTSDEFNKTHPKEIDYGIIERRRRFGCGMDQQTAN